ncbi:MAG: Snf7 family protein [Promethearchaeota archaeon]
MGKLFPKKKTQPGLSEIAQIRASIDKIQLEMKKYEKITNEFRLKAKNALVRGNTKLAKGYLIRSQRAQKNLERCQDFIMKLERQADALQSVKTLQIMKETMVKTTDVLERSTKELNAEKIDDLTAKSEEAMETLEYASEVMTEGADLDMDLDLEDELASLQTEVALEKESGLPSAPITGMQEPALSIGASSFEDSPIKENKSEKIKEEFEKLQKELDL